MAGDHGAPGSEQTCVTCADEALPARVVRLLPGRLAIVDDGGRPREVSVGLVDARAGDTVLLHAGEAIALAGPAAVPASAPAGGGADPAAGGNAGAGAELRSLYPFLYASAGDLPALLASLTRSTVDKIREVTALRRTVLARDGDRIATCARRMAAAFAGGGRLFGFGNGGSATDAAELVARCLDPGPDRRALPAYLLTGEVAVLTALANDAGFEVVFARQLAALGRAGDIAVGFSTSGGSANLLAGFAEASRRGMLTIGLSGGSGGAMATLDCLDFHFVVPATSVHRIQEVQATVYHVLWELALAALDQLEPGRARTRPPWPTGGRPTAREGT